MGQVSPFAPPLNRVTGQPVLDVSGAADGLTLAVKDIVVAHNATDAAAVTRGSLVFYVEDYRSAGGTDQQAIAATFTAAKAAARFIAGAPRVVGVPVVRFAARSYQLTATILREFEQGVIIEGAGPWATVIRTDVGIVMFDLHRAGDVTFRDLTICCGDIGTPWITGLVHGTVGVRMRQLAADSLQNNSGTNRFRFHNVHFIGLQRALSTRGDQMTDDVTLDGCVFRDNFYDIDSENGQAYNWRYIGGEVLSGVDAPGADLANPHANEYLYNQRLALWPAGSEPVTAKAGQFQNPATGTGATQNVTIRDGAFLRTVVGGAITCIGTSFIMKKTRVLFGALPTDPAAAIAGYGNTVNQRAVTFIACNAEMRGQDTVRDSAGYERIALIRYERPHPDSTDLTLRAIVSFYGETCTVQAASMDLIHLANGVQVHWLYGSRAYQQIAGTSYLVSHVIGSGSTYANRGRFVSAASTLLARRVVGKLPSAAGTVGTVWAAPSGLDHLIDMAGGVDGSSMGGTALEWDRSLQSLVPFVQRVVVQHEVDDTLIGSGVLNAAGVTRTLRVPSGAVIRRVGIHLRSVVGGTPTPLVLKFRNAANTVTYATCTALWATTASATETVVAGGRQFDSHRNPWCDVNLTAPTDGQIVVEVVTGQTVSGVYFTGHAWVEVL